MNIDMINYSQIFNIIFIYKQLKYKNYYNEKTNKMELFCIYTSNKAIM
jgi:hypothetical protein